MLIGCAIYYYIPVRKKNAANLVLQWLDFFLTCISEMVTCNESVSWNGWSKGTHFYSFVRIQESITQKGLVEVPSRNNLSVTRFLFELLVYHDLSSRGPEFSGASCDRTSEF